MLGPGVGSYSGGLLGLLVGRLLVGGLLRLLVGRLLVGRLLLLLVNRSNRLPGSRLVVSLLPPWAGLGSSGLLHCGHRLEVGEPGLFLERLLLSPDWLHLPNSDHLPLGLREGVSLGLEQGIRQARPGGLTWTSTPLAACLLFHSW